MTVTGYNNGKRECVVCFDEYGTTEIFERYDMSVLKYFGYNKHLLVQDVLKYDGLNVIHETVKKIGKTFKNAIWTRVHTTNGQSIWYMLFTSEENHDLDYYFNDF